MDNSWTSNELLFSFEGRINRAKYWYALYAGMISFPLCLVILALALSAIFGVSIKSVHLNIYDVFNDPPSFPFRVSFGSSVPGWLAFLLFYGAELRSSSAPSGSWRPPRSSGFTIATKAAGGSSRSSLRRICSAKWGLAWRCLPGGLPHARHDRSQPVGFCRNAVPERDKRAQSIWPRPAAAGAGQSQPACSSELGPAERAGICSARCWPIAGRAC